MPATTVSEIIAQSDELFAANEPTTLFAMLHNAVAHEGMDDARVQWRFARACYLMSLEHDAKEDKAARRDAIAQGYKAAKRAVEALPDDAQACLWMGCLFGEENNFLGTKEQIANAYTIREYLDKAVQLDPQSAIAFHSLGMWHWEVLQIGAVARGVGGLLYGKPPKTTYEACEQCLRKSAALDPTLSFNNLQLGELYRQRDDKAAAKEWYRKAAECPAKTAAERKIHDRATRKMGKC